MMQQHAFELCISKLIDGRKCFSTFTVQKIKIKGTGKEMTYVLKWKEGRITYVLADFWASASHQGSPVVVVESILQMD